MNINYINNKEIINFFWNIREFITYSKLNYINTLKETNKFYKIYNNFNINNINYNYDLSLKYFQKILNNYQSIIYTLPLGFLIALYNMKKNNG